MIWIIANYMQKSTKQQKMLFTPPFFLLATGKAPELRQDISKLNSIFPPD